MFGLTRLLAFAITVLMLLVVSCTGKMQVPQPCLRNKKNSEEEDSLDVHNIESAIDGFVGNGNFTTPEAQATIPRLETNAKFSVWRAVRESLKRGTTGAFGGIVQASRLWNLFCIQYCMCISLHLSFACRKQSHFNFFHIVECFSRTLQRRSITGTIELK